MADSITTTVIDDPSNICNDNEDGGDNLITGCQVPANIYDRDVLLSKMLVWEGIQMIIMGAGYGRFLIS